MSMRDHRDRMTALARRMESLGVRVVGWHWMEQGGPYVWSHRIDEGHQGEEAEPVVRAGDVERVLDGSEQRDEFMPTDTVHAALRRLNAALQMAASEGYEVEVAVTDSDPPGVTVQLTYKGET